LACHYGSLGVADELTLHDRTRRPHWLKTGLLVVATLLVANGTLVLGRHTGRWDASDFFCPYFTLVADHARQGQLLLWTPLVNSGCPAGVDPQVGAFSPLTVAMAALTGGQEWGFRVYWLTLWSLGGLGILMLARHLAAPTWAGYLGAVGFMFSAIYLGHAQHTSYLVAMSCFPWVLWRWDVALSTHRLAAATEAGAIWGLSALAGYPGMVVAGAGYAALWGLARLLSGWPNPREETSPAGSGRELGWPRSPTVFLGLGLTCFAATGLVVMAPTYVGFLRETEGYSDRSAELPREVALHEGALDPRALATATSPYLATLEDRQGHRPWTTDVSMCGLYLTPPLLLLALGFWPVGAKVDRQRRWLAVLAGLYLLLAMSEAVPLRGWLYDLVPPTRYFRFPALFRCYSLLTLVVMALLASRRLGPADRPSESSLVWWRWAMGSIGLAGIAMGVFACALWFNPPEKPGLIGLAVIHVLLVWPGAAALVVLGWRGDAATKDRVLTRYLVGLVALDALLTVVLSKPIMYTHRDKLWGELERQHIDCLDLTGRGLDRLRGIEPSLGFPANSNLLFKTPTLCSYSPLVSRFYQATIECPVLAAAATGPDRVWFCPTAAEVPRSPAGFERLAQRSMQLGRPCLVVSDPVLSPSVGPAKEAQIASLPAASPVPVHVERYSPNDLILDVDCPGDGWLLVTDRWARGWQARVNGRQEKVWQGNFVFRAVPVEKGKSRVEFHYRPFGYPWLLVASWSTLGLVLFTVRWDGSRTGGRKMSSRNIRSEVGQ
jgi:hypothetical protein